MDSNQQNCCPASCSPQATTTSVAAAPVARNEQPIHVGDSRNQLDTGKLGQTVVEVLDPSEIMSELKSGHLLTVNRSRRNGLIVYKRYYAEFAGPGAAVGGVCDVDCQGVLPVGNLELVPTKTSEEGRQAYLIRLQWIRFTHQFTNHTAPLDRAQRILQHFDAFFGSKIVSTLPDEAFALLVGVLPQTIHQARLLSK